MSNEDSIQTVHEDSASTVAQMLTRRRFLAGLAAAPALAALAACTRQTAPPAGPVAVQSPPATVAPSPTALPPELAGFLAVSAVLTGFGVQDLDPERGATYLKNIQADPSLAPSLAVLIGRGGGAAGSPSPSPAGDPAAALLSDPATAPAAKQAASLWYTGILGTGTDQSVVTFTNALAWKSLGFAVAPSQCLGSPGVWGDLPAVQVA